MYLTELRHNGVAPGHWPAYADAKMLNLCYPIADAVLNSWKEAHDAFNNREHRRTNPTHISDELHREFSRLIGKAMKMEEEWAISSFGNQLFARECMAYAMLVDWIDKEDR